MTRWDTELFFLGITDEERELTLNVGMPAPMAVGYIKARRKDYPVADKGLGDIFGKFFS